MKFGLIVPTLYASDVWHDWLSAFNSQSIKPARLLIIDSDSSDNAVALAKENGFDVRIIERSEFDHGATRQLGVDGLGNIDVYVFITQDAILLMIIH